MSTGQGLVTVLLDREGNSQLGIVLVLCHRLCDISTTSSVACCYDNQNCRKLPLVLTDFGTVMQLVMFVISFSVSTLFVW